MSFFDRFFGKSKPVTTSPTWEVRIVQEADNQGLRFGLIHQDIQGRQAPQAIGFPLELAALPEDTRPVPPETRARAEQLYELLRQGQAEAEEVGVVLIRPEQLAALDPEARGLLGLRIEREWEAEVAVSGVLGSGGRAQLGWTHPDGTYLGRQLGERFEHLPCGILDRQNKSIHLLPPEMIALREAVARAPSSPNKAEEARYIAHVQEAIATARRDPRLRLKVNEQLEKETWIAPDRVQIDVKPNADGGLEISPRLQGVEDEDMALRVLDADPRQEVVYRVTGQDKRGRVRVALSPQVREAIHVVRRRRRIPKGDVARFLEDPRGFLQSPEEVAQSRVLDEDGEEEDAILDMRSLEAQLATLREDQLGERVLGVEVATRAEPAFNAIESSGLDVEQAPEDIPVDEALLEALTLQHEVTEPEEVPAQPPQHIVLQIKDNVEELAYDHEQHLQLQERRGHYPRPMSFKGDLFPHQESGYAWLCHLYEQGVGGLLADDMGLGKTVQVIAWLAWLRERGELGTALIIAPKSVLSNWRKELRRFCPSIRHVQEHSGAQRTGDPAWLERCEVIITTYDTLRADQLIFGRINFSVIVCDEAQSIKNPTTLRARACRAMKARVRLALTATPVENRLQDLWAIMDFAQPGLLGSLRDFERDYANKLTQAQIDQASAEAAKSLRARLGDHYLRRTKEDHLRGQLPTKRFYNAPEPFLVPLSEAQLTRYRTVQAWLRQNWGQGKALEALRYLQDICIHPEAFRDPRAEESQDPLLRLLAEPQKILLESPKLAKIIERLEDIKRAGERAIVFARSRRVQRLTKALLLHHFNLRVDIVNGETSASARQELVDAFNQSSGFNILLLSPEAAGIGLNIVGANHVIHLTRLWNPAKENQATDRVYRIGQKRDVTVYVPIASHPDFQTVEVRLDAILQAKRALAEHVIQPREGLELTQREIQSMVFGGD